MSEENFNRLVSSELQGNSYLHSETVYSIRWAQNEIKSLREEVERLRAIINEANAQKPVAFIEAGDSYIDATLNARGKLLLDGDKLYAKPVPAQQSPRITGHDMCAIASSAVPHYILNDQNTDIDEWMIAEGQTQQTKHKEWR